MNGTPCKRAQLRFSPSRLMTSNFSPRCTALSATLKPRDAPRTYLVDETERENDHEIRNLKEKLASQTFAGDHIELVAVIVGSATDQSNHPAGARASAANDYRTGCSQRQGTAA